jgi:hypothetical protein
VLRLLGSALMRYRQRTPIALGLVILARPVSPDELVAEIASVPGPRTPRRRAGEAACRRRRPAAPLTLEAGTRR